VTGPHGEITCQNFFEIFFGIGRETRCERETARARTRFARAFPCTHTRARRYVATVRIHAQYACGAHTSCDERVCCNARVASRSPFVSRVRACPKRVHHLQTTWVTRDDRYARSKAVPTITIATFTVKVISSARNVRIDGNRSQVTVVCIPASAGMTLNTTLLPR
jgi:hypothetical protein